MPIVGTAGHVDHGKSTLVQALTGRDPDRWAEEKERGLTIDLGFAWTEIEGIDVGFVDVPGHERFIKNMLAGVGGIDCALLVVAADGGWMPQTEEHAAVLDLLDTRAGVIALTRIDLVDDDTRELAALEIMEETAGTVLADWPIVPVSPITGEGLDELRAQLATALGRHKPLVAGPLRMWIDRSFTISGAGVVVTGTVSGGRIAIGDEVAILPGGRSDRVRGLHHHDHAVDEASAGSRTAINLQSSSLTDVPRGTLICTPGTIAETGRILTTIEPARGFDEIPPRGAFHVHLGTAHIPVQIRQLHDSNAYMLTLSDVLPVAIGDRFILRDTGRRAVVGGGRVLDPRPADRVSMETIELLAGSLDRPVRDVADALLTVRGITRADDLAEAAGGVAPSCGTRAGPLIISEAAIADIALRITDIVGRYHDAHPLRPGMAKPEVATRIGLDLAVIEATVRESESLRESNGSIHLVDFVNALTPQQESTWERVRSDLEASYDVPRMGVIDLDSELLHALVRRGDLIQVAPDLVFTQRQVNSLTQRLGELPEGFTVSQFKEAFGMTRRQAIPTLEWLDKSGWTRRSGDGRSLRRRT
ncbi:MAG: selenocysteine-specific translation elongation factor [Actinomycetota bacterium]|nr:selenocysteine-specific translation elongation factor [Actinomycetota bacterium]